MKLPEKPNVMLQHFSWLAYAVTIALAAVVYYGYVLLKYYRAELAVFLQRLTGKPSSNERQTGDLLLPELSVLGATRQDGVEHISQEDLLFTSEADDLPAESLLHPVQTLTDAHLLGELSAMIAETKTLIRVINESSESKENFEMLFRLIIQKYPELIRTPCEDQVNHFLLNEGAEHFPFSLSMNELKSYWTTEQNLQSA